MHFHWSHFIFFFACLQVEINFSQKSWKNSFDFDLIMNSVLIIQCLIVFCSVLASEAHNNGRAAAVLLRNLLLNHHHHHHHDHQHQQNHHHPAQHDPGCTCGCAAEKRNDLLLVQSSNKRSNVLLADHPSGCKCGGCIRRHIVIPIPVPQYIPYYIPYHNQQSYTPYNYNQYLVPIQSPYQNQASQIYSHPLAFINSYYHPQEYYNYGYMSHPYSHGTLYPSPAYSDQHHCKYCGVPNCPHSLGSGFRYQMY